MTVETSIKLDTSKWDALLQRLSNNVKRSQKVLRVAVQAFAFQDIIDHFKNEEGPGGRWRPRSPSTQYQYAMIASGQWRPPKGMAAGSYSPSNKLLQLTGYLRQSVGPTNMRDYGTDGVQLFSAAKYSGRHNRGGGGVPQREFMWLSNKAKEKIVNMVAQLIMENSEPS